MGFCTWMAALPAIDPCIRGLPSSTFLDKRLARDVVVFDRGHHVRAQRGPHPVFRQRANARNPPATLSQATTPIAPPSIPARRPGAGSRVPAGSPSPHASCITLRAVATTPSRPICWTAKATAGKPSPTSCHARRGVEEHYKVVKRGLRLEPSHGQSEDWVPQVLWTFFTLMAMTKLSCRPLRG